MNIRHLTDDGIMVRNGDVIGTGVRVSDGYEKTGMINISYYDNNKEPHNLWREENEDFRLSSSEDGDDIRFAITSKKDNFYLFWKSSM